MSIIYDLLIYIFKLGASVKAKRDIKARHFINGRIGLLEKIEKEIDKNANIAWFHCASLGEFEQGRPVIEKFREKYPAFKVLLTFFSPSGYEVRKSYEKADYVYYLPFDTKWNVRRFLDLVNPKIVFFIKYEFWFNFIKETNRRKIPLFLISGIFRKTHIFFKWYGIAYRQLLNRFTHIFVQNIESYNLLRNIGMTAISVCGDTRFDRVTKIALESKKFEEVEQFRQNNRIIVAGSTWEKDEQLLIEYINNNSNEGLKYIIAPHEVEKNNIDRIVNSLKVKYALFSQSGQTNLSDYDVLVIDSIGILSSLYKYGDIAFIGGGFGKGIHNILEAATFGLPVIFGPNYHKFNEAVRLIEQKGAFPITCYSELQNIFNRLITDKDFWLNASRTCKYFVKSNKGASRHILNTIEEKNILSNFML